MDSLKALLSSSSHVDEEEQRKSRARDWSELPSDVSNLIADKISSFRHLQMFRACCKAWSEITPNLVNHEAPMLLLPYNKETKVSTFIMEMKTSKLHNLKMPELEGRWICGSSNGWLAGNDSNLDLFLLNPVTREQIKHTTAISVNNDVPKRKSSKNPAFYFRKVVLSDDPSKSDCLVAVIYYNQIFRVCRIGEETRREAPSNPRPWLHNYKLIDDVSFYKGLIFAVSSLDTVEIFSYLEDGRSYDVGTIKLPPKEKWLTHKKYLVEWGDELYCVLRFDKFKNAPSISKPPPQTWRFEVYKLSLEIGKPCTRVDNLGEVSFFLGRNDSISISAKKFPWCKPNCIYFTQHTDHHHGYQWDNGVYSLEEQRVIEKFDIQHSLSFWPTSALWYRPMTKNVSTL